MTGADETAERAMDQQDRDLHTADELVAGADADSLRTPACPIEPPDERLCELLARWEELRSRHEDPSPESLGVDDPELIQALRQRIITQKRLYAFLGFAPAGDGDQAGPPPPTEPPRAGAGGDPQLRAVEIQGPIQRPADTHPQYIGRYRIVRSLGRGGFGEVYLAHDADLDREVAIKVPLERMAALLVDFETYLDEARVLARLSHPNIVPVYDVGRTDARRWYVVSKYMAGGDLAAWQGRCRPTYLEATRMVTAIADALHYTHTQDLFHRDIKPANILLDASGVPYLSDFGLALRDEDVGQGARQVGTAAYMSPEQARGEGHLVDGRSDIFSLGIVLYELLTGRRPFRGDSRQAVMLQIIQSEARPPRQIDDAIPRELERICMKAISKRASDRYSTAKDFADDLRHFQKTAVLASATEVVAEPGPAAVTAAAPEGPASLKLPSSDSSGRPIKIVPRGLSSFDEHDADFFLDLLPGTRDRDGLPEGLRFWKTRIDATDPDKTFRVGLIYGPSGCGKSSQIKAGLLPRRAHHVMPVYIEATAEDTETRLVRGVRKLFPDLPRDAGLVGSLAMLRKGNGLGAGQKLLLVLDQFEQWLFGRSAEQAAELVAALRQCDGEHVQALCLIRDDFWMAATRFMREVEVDLIPSRNVAAVDLFDLKHARKVLAAYGRAYETLPGSAAPSKEHNAFLDQAVAGLAVDGRVVPVRLALFAEMVKDKRWAPATLRGVGGMEGVGVTFLEETFSSSRASPEHRLHQTAARAVLKSLLPETNADIKGRLRSIDELREVSGYAERPSDFHEVIRILDGDLRLITPVDTDSSSQEIAPATPPRSGRCYQLTHDYLVQSLRDWLTRKQRETRRGRAELLLAERAELWSAKPERRNLPSAPEWLKIRLYTSRADWTEPQRQVMRSATRCHLRRGAILAAVLAVAGAGSLWIWREVALGRRAQNAANLVSQLIVADNDQVQGIMPLIDSARDLTYPKLSEIARDVSRPSSDRLRAALVVLAAEPSHLDYVLERVPVAGPEELQVICNRLRRSPQAATDRLWNLIVSDAPSSKERFRIACALAALDPGSGRWPEIAFGAAGGLIKEGPLALQKWVDQLRPVRESLIQPLVGTFRKSVPAQLERSMAVSVLADYAADRVDLLAELIQEADPSEFDLIYPALERQEDRSVELLSRSLERSADPDWKDPALDPAWAAPVPALVEEVERGLGLVHERFAMAQTIALDRFVALAEGLRSSGYRPIRVRPYRVNGAAQVAAIWTRDGRPWQISLGAGATEIHRQDGHWRESGYEPVDVAAYCGGRAEEPDQGLLFAAVWARAPSPDGPRATRLYAGISNSAAIDDAALGRDGFHCIALHRLSGPDGRPRFSGIYRKSEELATADLDNDVLVYEAKLATTGGLVDIALGPAPSPSSVRAELEARLNEARCSLEARPDDARARQIQADALYRLGRHDENISKTSAWIAAAPTEPRAYYYRALARAHKGAGDQAAIDAAQFAKLNNESSSLAVFLDAMVSTYSGHGAAGLERLESTIQNHLTHPKCLFLYGKAYALAAQATPTQDVARRYADRAVDLLKQAIADGYNEYDSIRVDCDLEVLRDHPSFRELLGPGGLALRYSAIWSAAPQREYRASHGLSPEEHRSACRRWASQGYRPSAIAVTQPQADSALLAASAWQRPQVPDGVHDELQRRQSRAAVALARLGESDRIWPLLKQSPDPGRRTYLIHDLGRLGIEPRVLLDRLDVEGDVSARRALLLALGEVLPERLSSQDGAALALKLKTIYAQDPDAGVHGCAGRLMRQMGLQGDVPRIDAGLAADGLRAGRDWYVSSEGLTFTIVHGPVEFAMGSPREEPQHEAHETLHLVRIERSFAAGATEVPIGLYERFLADHPEFRRQGTPTSTNDMQRPIENIDVFDAAAFCRWLGEREGLPKDEHCYPPIAQLARGAREGKLALVKGYLGRTGYRLPTEAECEFVCRAGSAVSRHYGRSASMLPHYGWSNLGSGERTHPVGELKPNDLGLFDTLGNVWEWCQDDGRAYRPNFGGRSVLDSEELTAIWEPIHLVLKGGSCFYPAQSTRAAARHGWPPTTRQNSVGFRVYRTIR
jgi:serine/threonine protein kinase/formylglycine-generating enzyme required for sulfatase activity